MDIICGMPHLGKDSCFYFVAERQGASLSNFQGPLRVLSAPMADPAGKIPYQSWVVGGRQASPSTMWHAGTRPSGRHFLVRISTHKKSKVQVKVAICAHKSSFRQDLDKK